MNRKEKQGPIRERLGNHIQYKGSISMKEEKKHKRKS